ncbi:kinase-like protein [Fomitiporia mediterranea MF3/22]|uniref:kinase-like protein n=1 Tax=Fomitiporia mediterranea (strain MF3/22) TaxID=694068 RepID=UPI0004408461|nr:kinase-like protein [Fomitiporia mediterranea MF3/22]EJD04686.1 kinase-like protein [Fomitiporia mediterranea MF3/22]
MHPQYSPQYQNRTDFTLPTLENLVPMFQTYADGPRFHANWSWAKTSGGDKVPRQLKIVDKLGQGYFSRVVIIERDDLREDKPVKFAAKVIGKKEDPMGYKWPQVVAKDAEEFTINEARLLIKLRHKNVYLEIMCYGAFENDDLWVIVLEYAQGKELYDRIHSIANLTEKVLVHYIRYDSSTPWYKDRIILSDFGFAICTPTLKAERRCGSPMFAAPELFKLNYGDQYTERIDIWSLGVTTYEILTAHNVYRRIPEKVIPPKSKNIERDVAMSITNEHIKKYIIESEYVMLSKNDVNPGTRKSAKELQEKSKWLKDCDDTYWNFNANKAWKRELIAVRALNETIGSKYKKHDKQDKTKIQIGKCMTPHLKANLQKLTINIMVVKELQMTKNPDNSVINRNKY